MKKIDLSEPKLEYYHLSTALVLINMAAGRGAFRGNEEEIVEDISIRMQTFLISKKEEEVMPPRESII